MVNRLVNTVDFDLVFDGLAGTLLRSFAKDMYSLDSPSKHQDRASVGKMPVHAIVFHVLNDIWHFHLVLDFQVWPTFHQHISAEFTGNNNHRAIELTTLVQVFDELGNWAIDQLFHIGETGVPIVVGIPTEKRFVLRGHSDVAGALIYQSLGQ